MLLKFFQESFRQIVPAPSRLNPSKNFWLTPNPIWKKGSRFPNGRATANALGYEIRRQAQYSVEIHKKFSLPVACILFVLVGAPLGIVARSGGVGTGAVYSIVFFVIYWVGLTGGEHMADKLMVSPELAMWGPNVVLAVAGCYFTWRLTRDLPMTPRPVSRAVAALRRLFLKAKSALVRSPKRAAEGGR